MYSLTNHILMPLVILHYTSHLKLELYIDYIVKTSFFMPKYNTYTIPISNAMYNEQFSEEMKYELLMNTYKDVRKAFTKLD